MPHVNVKEFESYIETAQQVGQLKGQLMERERNRDELKALLDAMQDDLDLMRERAVRAETELRSAKQTLSVLEKL